MSKIDTQFRQATPAVRPDAQPMVTGNHHINTAHDVPLGEILTGLNYISRPDLRSALVQQSDLNWYDAKGLCLSQDLLNLCDPAVCITLSFAPVSKSGSNLTVAIADPNTRRIIRAIYAKASLNVTFVLASKAHIQSALVRSHEPHLTRQSVDIRPQEASCRTILSLQNRIIFCVLALGALAILLTYGWFTTALFIWIAATMTANTVFKFVCMIASLWPHPAPPVAPIPARKLEKVSILIPLLNESSILDRLITRMKAIQYPAELLDIKLVVEASDDTTLKHINQSHLPDWITPLIVPDGDIQTKPRAMNYAMDFCDGSIIGIFDAEDAPEADQVYQAVRHLQAGDDKLACVQGVLDYYNANTNWLSRCFTIEYAILFRVILRGLQALSLPIPLGGTSVYFKRDVLEQLGRWDAHNVTEDADLGMRLYRYGYRCEMLDATTYEEANFRLIPWIKQRSRWLKGFVVTWLTHIKNPIQLYRDVGMLAFLAFNIMFFGAVSAYLAAPLVLPLWLISFGLTLPLYEYIPKAILHIAVYGFIMTELILLILALLAIRRPHLRCHWPAAFTLFLYWPIGACAAYKAMYELIFAPSYWDKTSHGINDHNYDTSIQNLTKSNRSMQADFQDAPSSIL